MFLPRVKSSMSMSCVILKFQMAPFSQLHGTEGGRNMWKGRARAGHRKGGKAIGLLPSGLWGKNHWWQMLQRKHIGGAAAGPLWSWNGNQEPVGGARWPSWANGADKQVSRGDTQEKGPVGSFWALTSPPGPCLCGWSAFPSATTPFPPLPHAHTLITSRESIFLGGTSSKELTCPCRRFKRHRFNPWVGKIPWRRAWQPTPVFLPGKFHGQRSLAGYSLWGCKESDATEATECTHTYFLQ